MQEIICEKCGSGSNKVIPDLGNITVGTKKTRGYYCTICKKHYPDQNETEE